MPKIALRAYYREISSLIDRGQTDEAVAHCQYILQTYPKHLQTYRLLGKAYLEAHRNNEAIDLFNRVLAVVPDDFTTHVGMSIIRGEEDDLNASIWHMERAFETQPSNQAIQDELKHLYGRRDGQEPTKVRLTRGALCRMYARGNQTRQAIAEIKSILNETPDRPDLEVLLARMYFQSGMTPDALALSQKILEKLPFCYDTNKLMVEILRSSDKMSEADFYLKKIIALDPYETYVTDPNSNVDQVPDESVEIEHYFYDPSGQGKPPVTGQNLQPETTDEVAPDWLVSELAGEDDLGTKGFTRILDSSVLSQESTPEDSNTTTQPVVTEPVDENLPTWLQGAEETKEEVIPDFLKSTGWATAGSITDDTPPAQVINMDEPVETPEGEIAPAEIPDWLQTMAPGGEIGKNAESAPQTEDSFSDWLSGLDQTPPPTDEGLKIQPEPQETPAIPIATSEPDLMKEMEAEPASPLPDWLQQISSTGEATITDEQEIWKNEEIQAEETSIPGEPTITEQPFSDEAFPIEGGTTILSPEDVPDWLQDIQPAGDTSIKSPEPEGFIPDVDLPSEKPPKEVVTMVLTPEEKDTMPEWLSEIKQSIPDEEPVAVSPPEYVDEKQTATLPDDDQKEEEQMPEWLHLLDQDKPGSDTEFSMGDTPRQFDVEAIIPTISPEESDTQVVEILDDKPTTSILPPNPEDTAEQLPDWLREMDTMPVEEMGPVGISEESTQEGFPDWLQGYNPPPAESPLPPNEPTPLEESTEEVPAWLQDLTVGTDEFSSELEIPDWLKDMQISAETGEEISAVSQSAELPVWLQDSDVKLNTAEVEEPTSENITETPELVDEVAADQPIAEAAEEQVEIRETVLNISDKPEEDIPSIAEVPETELPSAEESWFKKTDFEGVPGDALLESPEIEISESILTDESAAAAAAAIGIPLFAERAAQPGVTESLPPLTASQIQGEEVTELPEVMPTEQPLSEQPLEESEPPVEVQDATEVLVSDALDSIMMPEEIVLSEPEKVEEESVATMEEEPAEIAETEDSVETITPEAVEEITEEGTPELPEAVQPESEEEISQEPAIEVSEEEVTQEPINEVFSEEEVPTPVESEVSEAIPDVAEMDETVTENIPDVLPEVDYSVLFNNAQSMVEAGDYASAQPALNSLIVAEQRLDDIIALTQEALNRDPTDFNLLLTLGDAYGRSGKLQNALDAYTKAEEYLQ